MKKICRIIMVFALLGTFVGLAFKSIKDDLNEDVPRNISTQPISISLTICLENDAKASEMLTSCNDVEEDSTEEICEKDYMDECALTEEEFLLIQEIELKHIEEMEKIIYTDEVSNSVSECSYVEEKEVVPYTNSSLPTVEYFTGTSEDMRIKIEASDKWNSLIEKVCTEEGIDPIMVKVMIAQESVGNQRATNKNGNKTCDYGLMQVNSSWGRIYDYQKMLDDPEYAIRCGIDVIKTKVDICKSLGKEATVFNVAWFYNGYNKQGKQYAKIIEEMYNGLSDTTASESYVILD